MDTNWAGRGWKVDESLAAGRIAIGPDDRIISAQIRLDRRVAPTSLNELKLIFDRTRVRNEHQSSLALPDRLAGPFHPNKQLAKWYSASQQVACNAIVWLTHISGGITRIYFAYMGKVGTNLRQKIGLCVGVRITWITRDWMQFEYCRPCLKRRALNTLRKATTSSIDDKCGTNHRRKVRQSLTPENWKNKNA